MSNLLSQEKERSHRFKLSLRIAFPLILVVIVFIVIMNLKKDFDWQDGVLFIILITCYVYYIVYLVYYGFKTTIVDPISGAFVAKEMSKLIQKELNKANDKNIVLISISNLQDINYRYGLKNSELLLKNFVINLSDYFKKNGSKDIPIGRYNSGNFLFIIEKKSTHLNHLLRTFERKLSNDGINNIEVKVKFALVKANFDKNIDNVINHLYSKIIYVDESDFKSDIIKPDVFDELVCYAIDSSKFDLKFQTIKSLKDDNDMLNLTISLNLPDIENISKIKVMEIAAKNNYEIRYDIQIIKFIIKNFDFDSFNGKIFIEILPLSL
ncbi:MAG: diguanylate cyclase, partial [Campylobacter sp.]|nr:diguanylate cyclase [Campylobacter sp.]